MVLIISCLFCGLCEASKKHWYIPDYAKIQFAGNSGFLSVGTGYLCFGEKLQLDLFYGYVPSFIGGVDIHTISQKNSFTLKTYKLSDNSTVSPIAGFGVNIALDSKYSTLFTSQYPKYYYWTTATHLIFFVGAKLHNQIPRKTGANGIDIYFELGTIDLYLVDFFKSDYVDIIDILNISIGMTFHF